MRRDFVYLLVILTVIGFIAATEVGYISGQYTAAIMSMVLISSLVFSTARRQGDIIINPSDYPGQDVLETEVPGFKVKVSGKKLPERLMSERTLVVALIFALAWFTWYHHEQSSGELKKLVEAVSENTFVLSLNQAEREALRITMPESLKRKVRERQ